MKRRVTKQPTPEQLQLSDRERLALEDLMRGLSATSNKVVGAP